MAKRKSAGPARSSSKIVVKEVPISTLRVDEFNPRTHGEENLASIRRSLEKHGQREPLLAQEGTHQVIAGHGRLSVMRELGWSTVQVAYYACDEIEARELAFELNRSGELAGWDFELARKLREDLAAAGVDLELFTDEEWSELEKQAAAPIDAPGISTDVREEEKKTFQILVILKSARQQTKLLERLAAEGFECRAMVS